MRKFLTLLCVLLFCLTFGFALESVYDILPEVELSILDEMVNDSITLNDSTLNDGIVKLAPLNSMAYQRAVAAEKEKNSFSVGIVSFVKYPSDWEELSTEEKQLRVFNIMTSVSTQKGITYISKTAGYKEKTLMEDSYCISNPDKKNSKIPDPHFESVPSSYSMYSFQKDNRFGGNVFSLNYANSDKEVFLSISNTTAMKFMGISCVPKEKLSMFIDTYLTEEGIVVFSMATIYDKKPEVKLVVYTVDLEDSFQRRIVGFKDWFFESI